VGEYFLADGVEQELSQIWRFIAKDNPEAATRVVEAAYETFAALAENPGLGHPRRFRSKQFHDLRLRTVLGFDSYLVLYREIFGGIEVLHVSHAARNLNALLRRRNL
jgi:toxin ParE1/3/4